MYIAKQLITTHLQSMLVIFWLQKATQNVVTSENLDEKIREALSNEVLDDFIISPDTGKKKTITFKNLK